MTSNGINNMGFGLVELILYIAILALMMTSLVELTWNMIYSHQKIKSQQELNQTMRLAGEKINYEIRNAAGILSVGATKVSLTSYESARNPTEIGFSQGSIVIGIGSSGNCPISSPCKLTSNDVIVSNLFFSNLSTGDTRSSNISYSFEASTNGNKEDYRVSDSFQGSAEVRIK